MIEVHWRYNELHDKHYLYLLHGLAIGFLYWEDVNKSWWFNSSVGLMSDTTETTLEGAKFYSFKYASKQYALIVEALQEVAKRQWESK